MTQKIDNHLNYNVFIKLNAGPRIFFDGADISGFKRMPDTHEPISDVVDPDIKQSDGLKT